jgi:lysophospholipase L1-like esterase
MASKFLLNFVKEMGKSSVFRNMAGFFFILLFLGGFFILGKTLKKKWIVYVTLQSSHWKERNEEISQITPGKYKIIFLGNSLTELFDLSYYFKDTTILNCGIVGDFTEGLVKRASSISRLKPNKLFIEIGINDMIEQISLNKICANYEKLIQMIRKESPATKIYIQSNLPVIINRPSLFTGDKHVNELIKEQNNNLQVLAKNTQSVYIDIYSGLINQKDLTSLFTWDGIHFTPRAYVIWKEKVLPYLVSSESDK